MSTGLPGIAVSSPHGRSIWLVLTRKKSPGCLPSKTVDLSTGKRDACWARRASADKPMREYRAFRIREIAYRVTSPGSESSRIYLHAFLARPDPCIDAICLRAVRGFARDRARQGRNRKAARPGGGRRCPARSVGKGGGLARGR